MAVFWRNPKEFFYIPSKIFLLPWFKVDKPVAYSLDRYILVCLFCTYFGLHIIDICDFFLNVKTYHQDTQRRSGSTAFSFCQWLCTWTAARARSPVVTEGTALSFLSHIWPAGFSTVPHQPEGSSFPMERYLCLEFPPEYQINVSDTEAQAAEFLNHFFKWWWGAATAPTFTALCQRSLSGAKPRWPLPSCAGFHVPRSPSRFHSCPCAIRSRPSSQSNHFYRKISVNSCLVIVMIIMDDDHLYVEQRTWVQALPKGSHGGIKL